jgi:hypothetical protein
MIQAVLFDKSKWTTLYAREYLKNHGLKPTKRVHVTDRYYRYRLIDPKENDKYFTKKFNNGISYIIKI